MTKFIMKCDFFFGNASAHTQNWGSLVSMKFSSSASQCLNKLC